MSPKDKNNFVRGDIFEVFLPESNLTPEHTPPKPDIQLHGKHKVICLTDSTDTSVPINQVAIVPISKATSAVKNNKLTLTHLPILKKDYSFLTDDSYVLVFQSRSIGRHWLTDNNYVGNITDFNKDIMKQIGILSLFVSGSYDDIMEFAYEKLKSTLFSEMRST